ncbi:MAG: 3-dehydroquinate synthase [bacterium]|nr:3-dehydroquinate synthase [bacterium]
MKSINISLVRQATQYQIQIGTGLMVQGLKDLLAGYKETFVYIVTNDRVDSLYPMAVEQALPQGLQSKKLVLPDGELYKNLDSLSRIYDFLTQGGANRKSILIAFGGGVIGDMTGFAAATYMRGIAYIQLPTTLLSQVDSSVGGKTAVNHRFAKNSIGAFKQPIGVVIDVDFLKTLPQREFLAGYAELIKHGFIADVYLYQILSRTTPAALHQDQNLLTDAISRSCQVKANVVEQDEREHFQRALLNFGHTLAHFIETYTGYDQYLHGEAVIAGMDFAAFWSWRKGHLEQDDWHRVHDHLTGLGLKLSYPAVGKETFLELLGHDKKMSSQGVSFVALTSIGHALIVEKVPLESLWDQYQAYLALETSLVDEVA